MLYKDYEDKGGDNYDYIMAFNIISIPEKDNEKEGIIDKIKDSQNSFKKRRK